MSTLAPAVPDTPSWYWSASAISAVPSPYSVIVYLSSCPALTKKAVTDSPTVRSRVAVVHLTVGRS